RCAERRGRLWVAPCIGPGRQSDPGDESVESIRLRDSRFDDELLHALAVRRRTHGGVAPGAVGDAARGIKASARRDGLPASVLLGRLHCVGRLAQHGWQRGRRCCDAQFFAPGCYSLSSHWRHHRDLSARGAAAEVGKRGTSKIEGAYAEDYLCRDTEPNAGRRAGFCPRCNENVEVKAKLEFDGGEPLTYEIKAAAIAF